MRTTILTLALLALAGCVRDQPDADTGRTPAATQEKTAAPQKTPEQEFGEKWLFGDILDRINANRPPGQKLKKVPSRSRAATMYFVPDTPANDNVNGDYLDELHQLGFSTESTLTVQDRASAAAAGREVVALKDQQNVANVFAWGKYIFRGPRELLDEVRPLLP